MDLPARLQDDWTRPRVASRPFPAGPALPPSPPGGSAFVETARRLWRHRYLIVGLTAFGAAAAILIVMPIPSRYVAESRILVGGTEPRVLSLEAVIADISPDAERVQNEALVLQSRELAQETIQRLGLAAEPEFNPALAAPGAVQRIVDGVAVPVRGLVQRLRGGGAAVPETDAERAEREESAVIQALQSRVDVSVIGRSYVLSVKAQSQDPRRAAAIANTLAERYVARQRQDKVKATGQAEGFLDDRIAELRQKVQQADQAVEQYRQKNGLYKGANTGVTSQQLTELNTQLTLAQAAKAEAESRLREARSLDRQGMTGDTVPEVLRSPSVQSLKQQQVEAERRIAEISSTLGAKHPKMTAAKTELANVERKLRAEIAMTVQGLAHEAGTAASRYDALRRSLDQLKGQMGDVNKRSIQLDALEREAQVARAMLDETQRRAEQTLGQDKMVGANARVISAAAPPIAPGVPPKGLIVFLATAGALLLGSLIALLREGADRSYRRADEIVRDTGLPVLAMIPSQRRKRAITALPVREPLSPYAEALRRLHIGLDLADVAHTARSILFASAVPEEGKSTMVASLGRMLANSGRRVLLVDCDWRCPSQLRNFRCADQRGLGAFLTDDPVVLEDAVHHDDLSGLDVITSGTITARNMHLLASPRMRQAIDLFAKAYDLVLIDTPPVLVGAEVLALASMVDRVVFAVRWGHTPRDVAMEALRQVLDTHAVVAGVALSRVDVKRYRQYASSDLIHRYGRPALLEAQ